MPEKKQDSFTVTDRRLFTSDGELRREVSEEEIATSKPAPAPPAPEAVPEVGSCRPDASVPPPPTAAEQKEQADAYHKSSQGTRCPSGAQRPFRQRNADHLRALHGFAVHERHAAARSDGRRREASRASTCWERGRPSTPSACSPRRPKAISLPRKRTSLQNCLYELRMAYVEVTNALARPPQATGTNPARR